MKIALPHNRRALTLVPHRRSVVDLTRCSNNNRRLHAQLSSLPQRLPPSTQQRSPRTKHARGVLPSREVPNSGSMFLCGSAPARHLSHVPGHRQCPPVGRTASWPVLTRLASVLTLYMNDAPAVEAACFPLLQASNKSDWKL